MYKKKKMMSPQEIVNEICDMKNYSEYDLKQLNEVLDIKYKELKERKRDLLLIIYSAMDKNEFVYEKMVEIKAGIFGDYYENKFVPYGDSMFDDEGLTYNTQDFSIDLLERMVANVKTYLFQSYHNELEEKVLGYWIEYNYSFTKSIENGGRRESSDTYEWHGDYGETMFSDEVMERIQMKEFLNELDNDDE